MPWAQPRSPGCAIDWDAFFKGSAPKAVPLPTYAFQKTALLAHLLGPRQATSSAAGIGDADHPLLSAVIEDPQDESLTLTGRLSLSSHPWLADHAVGARSCFPAPPSWSWRSEPRSRSGQRLSPSSPCRLRCPRRAGRGAAAGLGLGPQRAGSQRELSIHSRPESQDEELGRGSAVDRERQLGCWALRQAPRSSQSPSGPPRAPSQSPSMTSTALLGPGPQYGPAFQGLSAAWKQGEEIYAEASLPEDQAREAARFGLHPALLDAALHAIALTGTSQELSLPFAWSDVCLLGAGATRLRVRSSAQGERASR